LLEAAGGVLLRPPTPRRRTSRAAQIGEPCELRRRRSVGEERCPGEGELASPWCRELRIQAVPTQAIVLAPTTRSEAAAPSPVGEAASATSPFAPRSPTPRRPSSIPDLAYRGLLPLDERAAR